MLLGKERSYKLTPIQELLLALLRAQLWQKSVDDILLPSSIEEWNDLMDLAYKQAVICFISAACLRHKDIGVIPVEIREEMQAVIEENKKIHEHHNETLIELITLFKQHGLHPVLLKGQGLAQMYLQPYLRQCGDIDLYFQPDEYEKAKEFIVSIEDRFEKRHNETYKHFSSKFKGIEIEIHRHTNNFPNPFENKKFQRWTIDAMIEVSEIYISKFRVSVPPPIFNMASIFGHLWHHFEDGGISLRQICDFMMMSNYYYNIGVSKDDLMRYFEKFSLLNYFKIVECLCVERIGMIQRWWNDGRNDSIKGEMMIKFVFESGFSRRLQLSKNAFDNNLYCRSLYKKLVILYSFLSLSEISGVKIFWRYGKRTDNILYKCFKCLADNVCMC